MNWNTDCEDNTDLHVWREPYVWATSTGATVDVDAPLRNLSVLDSQTTRMLCGAYVDTPSRGATLGAFICGSFFSIANNHP